jgi:hypothetical protein
MNEIFNIEKEANKFLYEEDYSYGSRALHMSSAEDVRFAKAAFCEGARLMAIHLIEKLDELAQDKSDLKRNKYYLDECFLVSKDALIKYSKELFPDYEEQRSCA